MSVHTAPITNSSRAVIDVGSHLLLAVKRRSIEEDAAMVQTGILS